MRFEPRDRHCLVSLQHSRDCNQANQLRAIVALMPLHRPSWHSVGSGELTRGNGTLVLTDLSVFEQILPVPI